MKDARKKGYSNMPLTRPQALNLRLAKEAGVERGDVVPEAMEERDVRRLNFQAVKKGKKR